MSVFLLIVAALLVAGAALLFNRLVGLRNRAASAWSDIDVQLKRRHDLIPVMIGGFGRLIGLGGLQLLFTGLAVFAVAFALGLMLLSPRRTSATWWIAGLSLAVLLVINQEVRVYKFVLTYG